MKYEYIKDHSEFGALRQIPEMLQPNRFDYGEQRERFNLDLRKYTETVSTMPLYPLSVQPSEEWMQRKEYENGKDFATREDFMTDEFGEGHMTDIAIPIEKKGDDLVASQNHPQPESSVATLACTDGNSIEQIAERLFPYNEAVVNGEEINKLSKQLVDRRRRDFTNGFYYCDENRKHLRLLLIEAQETIKELQEENDRFKSLLKKESL